MSDDVVLRVENISKRFPGVQALDSVNFDVRRGELHALVGENGAGKSTIIKTVAGLYRADTGRILFEGREMKDSTPEAMISAGICTIYQELTLAKDMTVAENIFMGRWPRKRGGMVDYKELYSSAEKLLSQLGFDINPKSMIGTLSVAFRQLAEIARILSMNPKLVIFDEPTAVLGENEKEKLFRCIDTLKEQGVGIIYISHRMKEVLEISDRVTVLRDGKVIETMNGADANYASVVKLMVGRNIEMYDMTSKKPFGDTVLEIKGFTRKGVVDNISFMMRRGEVLGFYGLIGAGRTELMRMIYGLDKREAGQMLLNGKPIDISSPFAAIRHGIGLLPEDRRTHGLVLPLDIKNNISLANLKNIKKRFFVDHQKEKQTSEKANRALDIRSTGLRQIVRTLSGGNQQKVIVARWITHSPPLSILIFDEPTRGIDVGAKHEIHKIIRSLADEGMGIIMISSDMLEIMSVSDRIIVMREGRIRGELKHNEVSEESIIFLAAHE